MMNTVNYDKIFQAIAENSGGGKRLLLHSCCAPCTVSVMERLKDYFSVTLYFYNPNIDTEEEYYRRANELYKIEKAYDIEKIIIPEYNANEFLSAVKGYENYPEGGARCPLCFSLRLNKTADYADGNGFDYFGTTLTVSPHKNSALINAAGEAAGANTRAKFLFSDFKKREGYKRSGELSKEFGLYRQNYCGCSFGYTALQNRVPIV